MDMAITFLQLMIFLILVVLFLATTVLLIPKIVVRWAPKDIQEKVLARPDGHLWKTISGIVLAFVILLCIAAVLFWAGWDAVQRNMGFSDILVRYLILLEGYKLFDMVCFDYILLTKLNIFQKQFPETVGCKGYEKFGFNLKSQIIKILVFAVISVVIAVVLSRV